MKFEKGLVHAGTVRHRRYRGATRCRADHHGGVGHSGGTVIAVE